jgi:hypothetical protein
MQSQPGNTASGVGLALAHHRFRLTVPVAILTVRYKRTVAKMSHRYFIFTVFLVMTSLRQIPVVRAWAPRHKLLSGSLIISILFRR